LHDYPNHVYASNLPCVQMTELMTCEEQQNGLGSSGGSRGMVDENEVDGTSTSNNENDEIPLIIPNISPTLDDDGGDGDGDEGSGQRNSEDGDDGANSGEGNDIASNPNDNNNDDDLETTLPSVLPFP
ncbi:MAG: hypothetical protein ACRD8Z_25840, partial [Nitrososphaeraceae archaeon]